MVCGLGVLPGGHISGLPHLLLSLTPDSIALGLLLRLDSVGYYITNPETRAWGCRPSKLG